MTIYAAPIRSRGIRRTRDGGPENRARKVSSSSRRAARGARKPSPIDTVAVRAWARENGIEITERGRVPAEVVAKYRQAAGQ